jgi:FkbM family methyltransferase
MFRAVVKSLLPLIAGDARPFYAALESGAQLRLGKGWGAETTKQEVRQLLSALPRPPHTAWDVGGNVGEWTAAILGEAPECHVTVVEPDASLCDGLRERFATNRTVHVMETALSDADGTATLFADYPGSGLASLAHRDLRHVGLDHSVESTVRTMTPATLFASQEAEQIDILKLDIEGHELAVIRACEPLFKNIGAIQFEFGGANIDTRTYFRDFWYLLSPHYTIYRVSPGGLYEVTKYSEADETFITTNFVCVRR